MTARARLRLPKAMVSCANNNETWEPMRRELKRYRVSLTVLGLSPEGHPSIKLTGTPADLRAWLDQAGYWCVEVEA